MTTANNQIYSAYQLPAAYLPVHGIGYSTHDIVTEDVPVSPSKRGVHYVDAECGRGKTFSTCQLIKQGNGMVNQMYVAPTKLLLEQTATELRELKLKPHIIHSDNAENTVVRDVTEYLKSCEEWGNILLITWSAYVNLRYFHKREHWAIYIDEIPQVDQLHKPLLPYNYQFITDYLELGEPINETLSYVNVIDEDALKRHLDRESWKDDVYKKVRPILVDAFSPGKDLIVNTASWHSVVNGHHVNGSLNKNRIYFISMLKPLLFEGVILLGANIKRSMLYAWLTGYHDVWFGEQTLISCKLRRPMKHEDRVRISYFFDRNWSKSLGKKVAEGKNSTYMEYVEHEVTELTSEKQFLLVTNNDYKGGLLDLPNGVKMPVCSKGMNEFTDHNLIVHLPALNRERKHIGMLNQLGIGSETIAQSTAYETLYQNVMRTALRLPDSDEVVDIIVPSKAEADFLVGMFGSAEVKKVGDFEHTKYKPLTATEKNNRSKASGVTKRLTAVGENIQKSGYLLSYSININGNQKNEHQNDINGYFITMLSSYDKNHEDDYLVIKFPTIKDFVRDLKGWSKNIVEDKKDSPVISTAIFEPTVDQRWRKKEGFITASMMILDFDSGTVSPKTFEDIFWNNASENGQRAFILVNTFSRSPDNPNRFRVFMPFTHPVKDYEEYSAIHDSIVNRLAENGYPSGKSGLDASGKAATQMFFAPCTNRNYPESYLFNAKGCGKSEIAHYAINPDGYGRTALKPASKVKAVPVDGYGDMDEATRQAKIAAIKRTYLAVQKDQQLRNSAFYQAAWDLDDLMSLAEVEGILTELANGEQKMMDRIQQKIQSVRRQKYH